VQVAYAIGVAEPVSVMVDTFGTGVVPDVELERAVKEVFDLTPRGIATALDLRRPIYSPTSSYGHFGRVAGKGAYQPLPANGRERRPMAVNLFTWERTDRARALRAAVR
jgi:S-adenosylmethionine synthetase